MSKNDFMKYKEYENATSGDPSGGGSGAGCAILFFLAGIGFIILVFSTGYWYIALFLLLIFLAVLGS